MLWVLVFVLAHWLTGRAGVLALAILVLCMPLVWASAGLLGLVRVVQQVAVRGLTAAISLTYELITHLYKDVTSHHSLLKISKAPTQSERGGHAP